MMSAMEPRGELDTELQNGFLNLSKELFQNTKGKPELCSKAVYGTYGKGGIGGGYGHDTTHFRMMGEYEWIALCVVASRVDERSNFGVCVLGNAPDTIRILHCEKYLPYDTYHSEKCTLCPKQERLYERRYFKVQGTSFAGLTGVISSPGIMGGMSIYLSEGMVDILGWFLRYLNHDAINHVLEYVNFDPMFTRMIIPKLPLVAMGRLLNIIKYPKSAFVSRIGEYLSHRTGYDFPPFTTIWILHKPFFGYDDEPDYNEPDYEIYVPKYDVSVTHANVSYGPKWHQNAYDVCALDYPIEHGDTVSLKDEDVSSVEGITRHRFYAFMYPDQVKRYENYEIQMRSPLAKDFLDFLFRMKNIIPFSWINRRIQHIRWVPT